MQPKLIHIGQPALPLRAANGVEPSDLGAKPRRFCLRLPVRELSGRGNYNGDGNFPAATRELFLMVEHWSNLSIFSKTTLPSSLPCCVGQLVRALQAAPLLGCKTPR